MTYRFSRTLLAATCLACLAACDSPYDAEFIAAPIDPLLEEPALEAPVLLEAAPARKAITPGTAPNPQRGIVTAGDIDDTLNLAAFGRYQGRMAERLKMPRLNLADAVRLQVVDGNGAPAPGAYVTLRKPGAADPFYEGQAGVDGRLTVFPRALGLGRMSTVEARVFGADQSSVTQRLSTGAKLTQVILSDAMPYAPEFLDLVFVIDVSGSMGDEIAWLTREFSGLVLEMRRAARGADLRFGLVAYQSPGDPFDVRKFGMTRSTKQMKRWLAQLKATGGSGGPEVVGKGLQTALSLPWRRGHGARLMFQIGDEPPSSAGARLYLDSARRAAQKNVKLYGLGASGVEDQLEYLLRQGAVVTGGRYMFLTDDSGVGRAHAEPKVACYRVTRLKSLLTRVLQSELTGRRVEAPESEVMRSVGVYRGGVCQT